MSWAWRRARAVRLPEGPGERAAKAQGFAYCNGSEVLIDAMPRCGPISRCFSRPCRRVATGDDAALLSRGSAAIERRPPDHSAQLTPPLFHRPPDPLVQFPSAFPCKQHRHHDFRARSIEGLWHREYPASPALPRGLPGDSLRRTVLPSV